MTSSVSAVPPDLGGRLGERLGGLLDVDRHHLRAVAGEHLGDLGADAAGGAGDQRDLAVQRLVPVGGRHGVLRVDVEHLRVDVGRLPRQQEAQRGLQAGRRGLGVGGQVDQPDGGAALQLLAERAGEALERALGDALVDAGRLLRGGADDDDAAAGADVAQHRGEEVAQRLEALRGGDAGGVEDQAAERVGPAAADVVANQVVVLGQRVAQRLGDAAVAADQQGPGQRGLTRPGSGAASLAAGRRVAWPGTTRDRS